MRLLRALTKRARNAVLHVAAVIDTVGRLLLQHIQALAVDVPHARVPETSSLHPQDKSVRSFPEVLPTTIPSVELHGDGASDLAGVIHSSDFHRDDYVPRLQPGVVRLKEGGYYIRQCSGDREEVGPQTRY